jgi:hypothetical protein
MDSGLSVLEVPNALGSLPAIGAITYLTDDPVECQQLMGGRFPFLARYVHLQAEVRMHPRCCP